MGKDLAARYSVCADLFRQADEITKRPLSEIAFEGPDADLTQTRNCQPALFVHVFETSANQTPPNGAASASRLVARFLAERRIPTLKI